MEIGIYTAPDKFQSTPSLRKVTFLRKRDKTLFTISIHTFLAEGDANLAIILADAGSISIHTFLAEGDRLTDFWC